MNPTSKIRQALYRGDREEADRAAAKADLDVFEAAALGDSETLHRLLAADPSLAHDVADDEFTALALAAFLGDADSVRVLIEAGADVNAVAQNDMKVQPLHAAAARPYGIDLEMCRLLLEAGADPNAKQQGDHTPMDEAALRNHDGLIALLREYGAQS